MRWPILGDLSADDERRLLQIARRCTFKRGEVVFHLDDPGDRLHLIVKGRVGIHIATPKGETAMLAVRGPGQSFGELALVSGRQRRIATVTALEDTETFSVAAADFERLRREHPTIEVVLERLLVGEIELLNERLLETLYVPVDKRLLRRLVALSAVYPPHDGRPSTIPLTQEQLADLAGASRATVNRLLREEAERGSLELRRGRTILLDPDELARRSR